MIKTDLSDHYITFVTLCKLTEIASKHPCNKNKSKGDMTKFFSEAFKDDLEKSLTNFMTFLPEITINNFNSEFSKFVDIFKSVVDKHAPFKLLSRRQSKFMLKPWITKDIKISIKKKQKMYKSHYLEGNEVAKLLYKNYANKLSKIKNAENKRYFGSELHNCKTNIHKTWDIIKSLLPKKTAKQTIQMLEASDGTVVHDPKLIEIHLGDYFSTVATTVVDNLNILPDSSSFNEFLHDRMVDSIFLQPRVPTEVFILINNALVNKKACGPDNISPYLIKVAAAIVSEPLSEFVNYSFAFGIFADILKLAKVVHVFKSGNKRVVTNYRPISLLSSFSKVFEILLYQRLDTFIRKHSIISPFQYGFRARHSTKHAVTDVNTMAYDNINDKKFTGVSFLDIKKAFDTVDHDILINKLEHYEIGGTANDLLKSYSSQKKNSLL